MTPYYSDEFVTLYHGDCREVLPSVTADAIVTDPPYGVGMVAFSDEFEAAVDGMKFAQAPLAAVFMSPRRVFEFAHLIRDEWKWERLLWMHKTADMAAPWRSWCMNSEAIIIMSRGDADWPKPTDYRSDVYSVGPWERTGHPNGKPLAVVGDLVRRLTTECVLDPFSGSGTTLVAAKQQGIRAIGIELEERYCEIAVRRLAQGVLFERAS